MVEVMLAHRQLAADAVVAGMRAALSVGSVDPEVVMIEARRAAGRAEARVVPIGSLARYDRPAPSLDGYDSLLEDFDPSSANKAPLRYFRRRPPRELLDQPNEGTDSGARDARHRHEAHSG